MKKFSFPLRSVQTVREIREMNAREAFSAALQAAKAAEEALSQAKKRIVDLDNALMERRKNAFRASEQIAFLEECKVLREMEKTAGVELKKANDVLAKRRQAWIAARRDMRVIENLETKARQEYRREFERQEQAQADDRTNALFGRAPMMMS